MLILPYYVGIKNAATKNYALSKKIIDFLGLFGR